LKTWAPLFADEVFANINEGRFSVLYSENAAPRPNTPVNAVVGSLILKEAFSLSDDELLESVDIDPRFQYALHTTSCGLQPLSDRTLSRFRERLYNYESETGIDPVKAEMLSLSGHIAVFMGLKPELKRMDSLMIASACKRTARLEIVHTAAGNMAKAVEKTGELPLLAGLEHYLDPSDKNAVIYHCKEDAGLRLQNAIDEGNTLIGRLGDACAELPEYGIPARVLGDQANEDGKAKEGKEIDPSSLQNPSDPDATYRSKANKGYTGYAGNIVETFDENGNSLITGCDYRENTCSDAQFGKDAIEGMGPQENPTIAAVDGAYSGEELEEPAKEYNTALIPTDLTGVKPPVEIAGFKINEETREVESCPEGHEPIESTYYEKNDAYRVKFDTCHCESCPNRTACGAKMQKKSAVAAVSAKKVKRAAKLKEMGTPQKAPAQRSGGHPLHFEAQMQRRRHPRHGPPPQQALFRVQDRRPQL
jgi:hypothetical protein